MPHIFQVGAGSGGMPVLDMLCRDARITKVTLIEPDVYKEHNVERHLFPASGAGKLKADMAAEWLKDRRADLDIEVIPCDLLDESKEAQIEAAVSTAEIGVCAADNETAKIHFDLLMRKHGKPWTLGEVLSGGIGGFVHWFRPGGPCYGCVASHLKRMDVDKTGTADYFQPGGAVHEVRIPAAKASIEAIASLHALITLELMENPKQYDPGFTSLLWSLKKVPDVFEEAFRPYRFRIPRLDACLICQTREDFATASPEELDVALDQALARLGDE